MTDATTESKKKIQRCSGRLQGTFGWSHTCYVWCVFLSTVNLGWCESVCRKDGVDPGAVILWKLQCQNKCWKCTFLSVRLRHKKKKKTWLGKELWNCNTDGYCPDVSLKVTSGSAQMPKRRLEQWSLACQPSHPAVTPAPSPSPDVNVILEARKGNVT